MKRKAFSLSEIIIGISIFLTIIFPTIKINKTQIEYLARIKKYNFKLDFLFSLTSYIYALPYESLNENDIEIHNYKDFQDYIFLKDFNLIYPPKENFILNIKISDENIDFYHSEVKAKVIFISLNHLNKKFSIRLIRFGD